MTDGATEMLREQVRCRDCANSLGEYIPGYVLCRVLTGEFKKSDKPRECGAFRRAGE